MNVATVDAGNDYIDIDQARALPGLRLVLSRGIPGPWGEAAKGLLHVKNIPYVRVAQIPGQTDAALRDWAGTTSAPVAMLDDEPARSHWSEIILLAERLNPSPSLIPADQDDRTIMFGLLHEICGQDGFAWNKRLRLFEEWGRSLQKVDDPVAHGSEQLALLKTKYGHGGDTDRGRGRIIAILGMLGARLAAQADRGSGYFIGDRLSALDIYWACFCVMIAPLPQELCAMTRAQRIGYAERDPDILAAAGPLLIAHRDRIYADHLELPMRF